MNERVIQLPFDVELPPARMLEVGNWQCMYENGNLRYISWKGAEVVRMIYGAVRDEQWQTFPRIISEERIQENAEKIVINYTAVYRLNDAEYQSVLEIILTNDSIQLSMKGVALSDFKTNRIGICVLHPIDACAGRNVLIKKPDGQSYESVFPVLINPHQPFKEIRQMIWTAPNGAQAELTFEGDVFETEDQRNWTDTSYKTYSRPLDLPHPYPVAVGETMEQSVLLKVVDYENVDTRKVGNLNQPQEVRSSFPAIGFCRPKNSGRLSEKEISLLKKLPFDHYRVEIHLSVEGWETELADALWEAHQLSVMLLLAVFVGIDDEGEVQQLIDLLKPEQRLVASLLVLDDEGETFPQEKFERVYTLIKTALPAAGVGYGTDNHFATINRNRPVSVQNDFLSYGVTPQAHATDTRTIMENLSAQKMTYQTAETFSGGKTIYVSPVRFTSKKGSDVIDDRQHTSLGAWWTLQTIRNLPGAVMTFYDTVGTRGIIKRNEGLPDQKANLQDLMTPLFKVLTEIQEFQPVFVIIKPGDDLKFTIENERGDRLTFELVNSSEKSQMAHFTFAKLL